MIEVKGVTKQYGDFFALNDVSLTVGDGEFFIITGRSGSGKSTLMKVASGLLAPTSGEVSVDGKQLSSLSGKDLYALRNKSIGYVFQTFGLEENFTAYENVELPLVIAGVKRKERKVRVEEVAKAVGLVPLLHKPARVLSGGEKQRVAIARAIVNDPKYLFADEPCGNLDSENTSIVLRILESLTERGITVIMVTHDKTQLPLATHSVELSDGKIIDETFSD